MKIGKRKEKFITYSALLGNTSVGKTPSMEIAETAAYQIEEFKHPNLLIDTSESNSNSTICNGATVEATIQMLKDQGIYIYLFYFFSLKNYISLHFIFKGKIMSFLDEAGIFLGSLGRYSSGGSLYDRGVFLNQWNGPKHFNRDLKGVKTRL